MVSVVVLFAFDPAQYSFYPRCTIKLLTGLDCPGCGGLRATHQLLHGQVLAAFRLNPLFVTLAPLAAAWLVWAAVQSFRRRTVPEFPLTPRRVWLLVAVTLGFSVLRNLPGGGL
ncbi:membrane protein [Verrucomicrobiota bacterium]|nr:membrane protein [Verrucomicrobiota bacterium]